MKKIWYVIPVVLLIAAALLLVYGALEERRTPAPPAPPAELTEEYVKNLPPLFIKEEVKDIDFTVLKDVAYLVRTYSVFTSPVFKDVFGDTVKDQAFLMRSARDTLFTGFLSVPIDQIPDWAMDVTEQEIRWSRYDYKVFNEIYQQLTQDPRYEYLNDPSQKGKLLRVMIEGMIKAIGDPFTVYLDKEQWIISNAGSSSGTYKGMGIGLSKNEKGELAITIISAGSPAEKAGLKPGDAILAVNEKSILEASVSRFIVYVKTHQDAIMELIIKRKLTGALERVSVKLEEVLVRAVFTGPGVVLPEGRGSTSDNLPFYYPLRDRDGREHPEILYIKIKEFSAQAAADLRYVLERVDIVKFKGIVIDLRDNPGGRLDAILHAVDYFLPGSDLITATRYYDGVKTEERSNQFNYVPSDLPIAVLVNENSASGAELFPSALRDNGRAVIISNDETTAGKGSINNYFTLKKGEYGALYISLGLWYTPSGQMIEKMDLDRDGYFEIGGVKPDIFVRWTNQDIIENNRNPAYYDPTLFEAITWLGKNSWQAWPMGERGRR